jgi:ABC-type glycerol-3-phosphate transport system substrate-binding protein
MARQGDPHDQAHSVNRRDFVKVAGASGTAIGLAGCLGDGESTDTDGTETVSGPTTIQLAADDSFKNEQSVINDILHENGVSDDITVEILGGSFVSSGRESKYKNILNAGQKQPTLFMMDNGWTIPFIVRDQIANLSEELDSDVVETVQNDYVQTMVATATMDGSLYGVPLFADFPTIQYRKDKLREAGYGDSDFDTWATESMTWKEFSNVVADAKEAHSDMTGYNFQGAAYIGLSCCDFVEFISSWGGSYFGEFGNLFGPVGDRPVTVDEQPIVDAINMVRHFIYGDNPGGKFGDFAGNIAPEAVVQYKEESSRKPFTNGNVLFHRNWPYSININGAEDAFGEDLGAMPIPYGVTAEESKYGPEIGGIPAALGGWHLTLNPNAAGEKKAAAKEVLGALISEEVQLSMFELGGWIPPVPDRINSDRAKELDVIGRYVDTLAAAAENAVPRPVTRVWPQEAQQINKEINAAFKRDKSAKEATSDLKSSLEQIENSG